MKRLLKILFLLIVFVEIIFNYSYLDFKLLCAKINAASFSINNSRLEVFKLSATEFKNINSEEFLKDGKLYDVVQIKQTGDSVLVYTVNDREEENILQNAASVFNDSDGQSGSNIIHKAVNLEKYKIIHQLEFNRNSIASNTSFHDRYNFPPCHFTRDAQYMPPDLHL